MAATKQTERTKDTKGEQATGGPTSPASVGKKGQDDRKPADNKKGGYGAG